jgi:ABC-type glutathione transport system ATPase component
VIISVRGPSGCGKSTLARAVMEQYDGETQIREDGRRRPIGYLLHRMTGRRLFVPGHYEINNGGADTISSLDRIYEMIEQYARRHDVLYEGKTMTDSAARALALVDAGHDVRVLHLTTPVAECARRVRRRLSPNGTPHMIAPSSIGRMDRRVRVLVRELTTRGVPCESLTLEVGVARALEMLELRRQS